MQRIDTERLQQLIDRHGAALTLYARQWCHAPEDALQEALIDLLRQDSVPDCPAASRADGLPLLLSAGGVLHG